MIIRHEEKSENLLEFESQINQMISFAEELSNKIEKKEAEYLKTKFNRLIVLAIMGIVMTVSIALSAALFEYIKSINTWYRSLLMGSGMMSFMLITAASVFYHSYFFRLGSKLRMSLHSDIRLFNEVIDKINGFMKMVEDDSEYDLFRMVLSLRLRSLSYSRHSDLYN